MNTLRSSIFQGIMIICVLAGLTGCNLADRTQPTQPTLPAAGIDAVYDDEGGPRFSYARADTPGVTVKADFTRYHLAGQPYGNWVVNATWRSADRKVVCPGGDLGVNETPATYQANGCAWTTVPVTIDAATGQGAALLPPEFLNAVFQTAHDHYQATGDAGTWHQRPGLYLNFFPADGDAWQYYAFK